MSKFLLLLLRIIITSVSSAVTLNRMMELPLIHNWKFLMWRSISNFLSLSSRLMVIMVISNGLPNYLKTIILYFLITVFFGFLRFYSNFKRFQNKTIRLSIAKMFVHVEDIDLTDIRLFVLNFLLYLVNLSVCIFATISHSIPKNSQKVVYTFYLFILLYVEFCMLLSILIEYFPIKNMLKKSLEKFCKDWKVWNDYWLVIFSINIDEATKYLEKIENNSSLKNQSVFLNIFSNKYSYSYDLIANDYWWVIFLISKDEATKYLEKIENNSSLKNQSVFLNIFSNRRKKD